MSIRDESCFVTSIMLEVVNKVHSHAFVSWWRITLGPLIVESFVFTDLLQFEFLGISPLGITIGLIQCRGMAVIAWYFHTIFVLRGSMIRPERIYTGLQYKQRENDCKNHIIPDYHLAIYLWSDRRGATW